MFLQSILLSPAERIKISKHYKVVKIILNSIVMYNKLTLLFE